MKANRKTSAKKTSAAKKRSSTPQAAPSAASNGHAIATAESYRKGKTGILEFSDGTRFVVRRPRPMIAILFQRLPTNLRLRIAEAQAGKKAEALPQTPEEEKAFLAYASAMVADICVLPRVEVDAQSKDALDVEDLDPLHFWKLFDWGERGGATIPLDTEGGGSIAVAELESFREQPAVSHPLPDSTANGAKTTSATRNP